MDLEFWIKRFNPIGSWATVKKKQQEILSKFVGWEVQTLTVPQKVQARKNIGIDLLYKTGQAVQLTKGIHKINFTTPFSDNYVVFLQGTTGAMAFAPVLIEWSNPAYFKVKMPIDGWLIWRAELVTEL